MTSEAFCPGHVTALFYAPEPGPSPETTGSRGAGVCVSLGARARVDVEAAETASISPVGDTRLSPVMATALGEYLGMTEEPFHIQLELEMDLPVGHGFGMSGAMTFAALVAAEGELGLAGGDLDRSLALAHAAEVAFSTGLGDVVAQARGGIDVRVRPGLPPHGEVIRRASEAEVLLAWSGRSLHTRSVLSDPGARRALEEACVPRLADLAGEADLDWLLRMGWEFAREAGLVSDEVERMVGICSAYGRASQVMLGNSVFAAGDIEAMGRDLGEAGFDWTVASVDNQGVRLLG